MNQHEDRLLTMMMTNQGEVVDEETAKHVFSLPGFVTSSSVSVETGKLESQTLKRQRELIQEITERNAHFFQEEAEKLDAWAEDRKLVLEKDIKKFDRQIKEAKRAATGAIDLQAKLAGQKQVRELERQRNQKRRSLFEAQDEVDEQRDDLIAQIEGKLEQNSELKHLFTIRWHLH